jgi:G:T/U-mismatch repair DNA glycosylase
LTTSGEPYKLTSSLRYGEDRIIPYSQQIETLASRGFALWDVVRSCQRQGSLDADIRLEAPNDIRALCEQHPSIRRVIFANGGTGSSMFNKHFKEWWKSGQLRPGEDEFSQRAFRNIHSRLAKNDETAASITCISAISVSPAAAKYSYKEKRDFWEEHVYKPGLRDFEQNMQK